MVVHYGESQKASADAAQSANQGTRNRGQDSRWERVGLQQIFEPQARTIFDRSAPSVGTLQGS